MREEAYQSGIDTNYAKPGLKMNYKKPKNIIAIEEHFMHPSLTDHFANRGHQPEKIKSRLYDFTKIRIQEMDEAGISMQILSHQSPGSQRLDENIALYACQNSNDALNEVINSNPNRFHGFAMLPTKLPELAAKELERAVKQLGLKGAMIHGLSCGKMIDEREFWPIFEVAEELDVPIYLHPADPDKTVTERYYSPYDKTHPMVTRAAWGFGIETGTQAVRLILSGIFDRYPKLKIFLGHFGEAIPFWLPRIHESFTRPGNENIDFNRIFKENFWITTSGFFSDNALELCLKVLNAEKILFAVDWPYANNKVGVDWLANAPIDKHTKKLIFSENAQNLFNL